MREEIEEVLRERVYFAHAKEEKPLCPGMKYRHYAPDCKVLLFNSQEEIDHYVKKSPHMKRKFLTTIYAQNLYANFREAEGEDAKEIVILLNHTLRNNVALMNRLLKASSDAF